MDEKAAIESLGSALIGTNEPLITTCGTLAFAKSELSTEDDIVDFELPLNIRAQSEKAIDTIAKHGVHACVVRLPPSVHCEEDKGGLIDMMTRLASSQGHAIYVKEGLNRWPTVHRHDVAHLYRLALEKGVAGSKYHGVAEEGVARKALLKPLDKAFILKPSPRQLKEWKD